MSVEDPRDVGQRIDAVDASGLYPKRPIRLSSKMERLSQVSDEYVFFTPGPLYLGAGLTDRLLHEHASRHGKISLAFHRFDQPIFRGLDSPSGDRSWNHVLWAIPRHQHAAFQDTLVSAVLSDPVARRVSRVGMQSFEVVDPVEADRSVVLKAAPSLLRVEVYCPRRPDCDWGFEQSTPAAPPTLKIYTPSVEMVQLQQALYPLTETRDEG